MKKLAPQPGQWQKRDTLAPKVRDRLILSRWNRTICD